jgi:hypothetical protein
MKKFFAITLGLLLLIVVAAPAQAQQPAPDGYYSQPQNWHGALNPQDQQEFDKQYAKWVDSQRKNDRDDIAESARHMQDIMTRANIPSNVPFDQIASNSGSGYGAYPNGAYAGGTYPAYPANGYPVAAPVRLSPDEQQRFDKDYAKWLDAQRKNDQSEVSEHAGKLREIMSRNGIPPNVPFAAVATNGYAANGPAPYPYAYGQAAQRLSTKDQSDFNKYYEHWVDARHKKDIDDVDKNARKMQEIMARYNIPANVSFDQVATVGAYH